VRDQVEYTEFRLYSAFLWKGELELRANEAALPGAQIDFVTALLTPQPNHDLVLSRTQARGDTAAKGANAFGAAVDRDESGAALNLAFDPNFEDPSLEVDGDRRGLSRPDLDVDDLRWIVERAVQPHGDLALSSWHRKGGSARARAHVLSILLHRHGAAGGCTVLGDRAADLPRLRLGASDCKEECGRDQQRRHRGPGEACQRPATRLDKNSHRLPFLTQFEPGVDSRLGMTRKHRVSPDGSLAVPA